LGTIKPSKGGKNLHHCYTPERLEKKAVEILSKYKDGELLLKPQAMDVDHFAEFSCEATIDFAYLSQDGLTLGLTCFNDGKLLVWDETRTNQYSLDVFKGYIFVDKDILKSEVEGRVRFTIIHECSHYLIHPRFYYKKPGVEIPQINCTVYHVENWDKRPPLTDEETREWQANRLGAALIMPAPTVRMLMAELLGIAVDALTAVYVSDDFIEKMAAVFVVSKSAMCNRLRDLDLLLQ
jgi:Zn-dependent peptidase ImmA (M78 family)